jgi:hypothetical protein
MVTGVLQLTQSMNSSVSKSAVQEPPEGSGVDHFAFWLPQRRPQAAVWAMQIDPPLDVFEPHNVLNGISRPWRGVNAWLPAMDDAEPWLKLHWPSDRTIRSIEISFDTDFDHPMESVLMGHPERVMPSCVRTFEIRSKSDMLVAYVAENHQTRWKLELIEPLVTDELVLRILRFGSAVPAIFDIRCF